MPPGEIALKTALRNSPKNSPNSRPQAGSGYAAGVYPEN